MGTVGLKEAFVQVRKEREESEEMKAAAREYEEGREGK